MRRIALCGFWAVLIGLFAGLGSGEAAEDMRFVDANGDTGYYVDAASVTRDVPSVSCNTCARSGTDTSPRTVLPAT